MVGAGEGQASNVKMLGRLGWRGQCSCCNGPRGKKAIRAEEKRHWRREVDEMKTLNGAMEPEPDAVGGGYMIDLNPQETVATNHVTVTLSLHHSNATMPIRSWSFPNVTSALTS